MEVDALVRYAAWSFDALMQIKPVLGKARIVSLITSLYVSLRYRPRGRPSSRRMREDFSAARVFSAVEDQQLRAPLDYLREDDTLAAVSPARKWSHIRCGHPRCLLEDALAVRSNFFSGYCASTAPAESIDHARRNRRAPPNTRRNRAWL